MAVHRMKTRVSVELWTFVSSSCTALCSKLLHGCRKRTSRKCGAVEWQTGQATRKERNLCNFIWITLFAWIFKCLHAWPLTVEVARDDDATGTKTSLFIIDQLGFLCWRLFTFAILLGFSLLGLGGLFFRLFCLLTFSSWIPLTSFPSSLGQEYIQYINKHKTKIKTHTHTDCPGIIAFASRWGGNHPTWRQSQKESA